MKKTAAELLRLTETEIAALIKETFGFETTKTAKHELVAQFLTNQDWFEYLKKWL